MTARKGAVSANYGTISLTQEARAEVFALREELTRRGTSALPRALAPPADLTVSEVILLAVRAVRAAFK